MSDRPYREFADFYATGEYVTFSERLAATFEDVLAAVDATGDRVLDLACGEGTFAVSVAEQGYDVVGVDASERMIALAREQAAERGVAVDFRVADVREADPSRRFDVVTCWFDSVNHLLDVGAVRSLFETAHGALASGGTFVFDVNTVRKLASYETDSSDTDSSVTRDTDARFEAYTDVSFDYETNVLSFTITGFRRTGDGWERFDERHRERGYPLDVLAERLRDVGFVEVRTTESIEGVPTSAKDPERRYFVAKRR